MKKKYFIFLILFWFLWGINFSEARMGPFFPIANSSYPEMSMDFATNGSIYAIPLLSLNPNQTQDLYVQFVYANGTLGQRVDVVTNSSSGIFDHRIAFGNGKFLLIWVEGTRMQNSTLKGIFISPNGTKGSIFPILSNIPSEQNIVPDLEFGANKFLVAYEKKDPVYNRTAIYGKFVVNETNISNEFRISPDWGIFEYQQIASNGTHFLVVYTYNYPNVSNVFARFVNSTGPTGSQITIKSNSNKSDNPLYVLFDGEKYLVVWTEEIVDQNNINIWQFYGRFIYPNGTMNSTFPITSVRSHKILPFISFDGDKYLITWSDGRNCGFLGWEDDSPIECIRTGYDIYGRYFSKNGTPLGREFLVSELPGSELGGFTGKSIRNRILGLFLKDVDITNFLNRDVVDPNFLSQDVLGRFIQVSQYNVFAPGYREKLMANTTYTIRWDAPYSAVRFNIYYSTDNGTTWIPIRSNHTEKKLTWNIPPQNGRKPLSRIKIEAYNSTGQLITTFFSSPFSIEVARIISPNGGEYLVSGQNSTIRWITNGLNATVARTTLQYSCNGTTWTPIKTVDGNPGEVSWIIPNLSQLKPTCLTRVIFRGSDNRPLAITESEAVFTISPFHELH